MQTKTAEVCFPPKLFQFLVLGDIVPHVALIAGAEGSLKAAGSAPGKACETRAPAGIGEGCTNGSTPALGQQTGTALLRLSICAPPVMLDAHAMTWGFAWSQEEVNALSKDVTRLANELVDSKAALAKVQEQSAEKQREALELGRQVQEMEKGRAAELKVLHSVDGGSGRLMWCHVLLQLL